MCKYAKKKRKEESVNGVTLKVENETIEANRMVLASRSLYFENMFKTEMKEKQQPTVELANIDGTAVKKLIEFMYTGSIIINNKNVLNLLSTADYLQMDEAKKFCFEFLHSVITADTCFLILNVASLYQNEQLKQKVLEFIEKDIGGVGYSNDLSKNDFITCISKLKDSDFRKAKESTIYQAIVSWVKFDEKRRSKYLLKLLFLLDFSELSIDFFCDNILREELVTNDHACLKFVTGKFSSTSKLVNLKQTGTKVLSFGGENASDQLVELYSCNDEPSTQYPAMNS